MARRQLSRGTAARFVRRTFDARWLAATGAVLTLLVACPIVAQTGPERLEVFLKDVRTLQGRFDQSLYDESRHLTDHSAGSVHLTRPGRFRWQYDAEDGQDLIANGKQLWIHDRGLEQVTVRTLDGTLGDSPALLLTSDRPVAESFVIEDVGNEAGVSWVSLQPKAEDSIFQVIRIGFDGDQLRFMELQDNFGNLTQLRFTDLQINADLDQAMFEFEPPAGADVIRD